MLKIITTVASFLLLFTGYTLAQHQPVRLTAVTGEETEVSNTPSSGIEPGSIIIANHTALSGSPVRTHLFINSAPGLNDFVFFDPGPTTDGGAIWPRFGVSNNDIVVLASSVSGGTGASTNTFNINTGIFSGWMFYNGNQAETYSFSTSNSGKIGHAYLDDAGGAWFRESTNEGITWGTPLKIFNPFQDPLDPLIYHGTIRGINLTYLGDIPKVVLEVYRVTGDFLSYYPALPSEIYFWSPGINGGIATAIADSNNVPFYENQGIVAVYAAINRPVIGKSAGDEALFVAFHATSPDIATTTDETRFMIGYFMMSLDGGAT
jgi:hypothetical protein